MIWVVSDDQVQIGVVIGFSKIFTYHNVHAWRSTNPNSWNISFLHFLFKNVLEILFCKGDVSSLLHFPLRIFPKFKSYVQSSFLSQVQHLLKGDHVHILDMLEGSKHFKGEIFEGISVKNGADFKNISFCSWIMSHELFFVEKINEVTERINTCSTSHKNNSSRFCSWKLKTLSFGLAYHNFFNRSPCYPFSKFTFSICSEHDRNRGSTCMESTFSLLFHFHLSGDRR